MSASSSRKNLLLIEDSLADARLVQELIKETEFNEYKITLLRTLQDLKTVEKSRFKAILLDLHLSDIQPFDTFKMVNEKFPTTPIIVLTGLNDEVLAAKIVRAGAQDYLVKGTIDSDTLQRTLKYSMYRKKAEQRIASQKRVSQKLKTRADTFETESIRLAKINQTKDVFLSIASHQLRTPATAVKQYLGMLLQGYAGELQPKQREFLETAAQSNERQIKIVEDLLRVARVDAGQVTLHRQPTNIIQLMRDVINDLSGVAATKKQKILFEAQAAEVVVNVDANNVRMVFENLLDNASKYSDAETDITVSVSTHDDWVYCEFIDSGIGISKQDQSKLFQKFSRIEDSFTYAPNGTGLGLYWAREIVKLHDGEIALESAKGKGSKFRVMLPVK